ncbi:hypothetical protein MJO28_002967 [Puccinia striiformis f. sp. tritici]|uniref:Uncharacterized protein n=2 Tax=Puccinia striiformis f. sp. tritici TaxID=168172 RepID=A0A0L0VB88_9BASI|nr:hypothetical protein MJO28_002967 [Puccinia striiformis f. sp. tritici]KNE96269.1 hypothetical protein PSTG_10390 [Puccinia striiformis f. sp. tritici PST-78]
MGNSDKSIGLSIFFLGSAGFIYCTISAFMILLFPITETDTGKIGHHPYLISYDLLAKIPAVGLTLFMAIVGTCISLVMFVTSSLSFFIAPLIANSKTSHGFLPSLSIL